MPNTTITPPRVPLIDPRTNQIDRAWYRWLYSIFTVTGGSSGITPVAYGGTGLSTIPSNGQLLIGTGTGYALNTLGYGVGISVTNGAGTVTVANTGVLSWSGGATGLTPATATSGDVVLAGTLIAANGGTGFASYAVGDLLYANTTTTLAKLPDVGTGNALISGGVGTAPAWGKIGLTTHVSGTLPIANGGTNGTATPTAGAISYGTGTAYGFTSAGTAGQVLTSAGAGIPTWTTPTTGSVTSVSVVSANGFAGTVATATTTPAITMSTSISGLLYGNGTALAAATISAPLAYSAGTLSITQSGASTNGYLSSTDWNTFNNKQPAGTYVTSVGASAPITSTGGTTPTIGVTAAALTKTDDTNVTLTLGGAPTTALLAATSLTLGWTGTLAASRGGTGLSSLGTGVATWLGTPSSANLAAAVTDETGSGALVFGTAPTISDLTVTGTSGNVFSGTYTPTQVSTNTNVDSVTFSENQYLRVGNTVTVSGQIIIDATTAATDTIVKMSIPIASNFSATRNLGGTGASINTPFVANTLLLLAEATNDCVELRLRPTVNTAVTYNFSYTYRIQ